jgi:hypothetical protein
MSLDLTLPLCFAPSPVRYNAGLALLSAILKARGVRTVLWQLEDLGAFWASLAASDSPWVCFSAVTETDYRKCLPFMRAAWEDGREVLLGGTWAGLGRPVDWSVKVCRGDGETLADYLIDGDDRLFRERMVCQDLDALPVPDYELFEGVVFDRGLPFTDGKKCLPYLSSRGCPYACTFCQVRQQPKGVRIRRKVGEDLTALTARYRPDIWFIGDTLLPVWDRAWRESWGDFRAPFVAYIRADIHPDELAWLVDRGMVGCAFGIESGDESYRNTVLQKRLLDEEVWGTVRELERAGVWFIPYFMAGSPGETLAMRTKTARMARQLGPLAITWQYEALTDG